jgi:hypothetical protein
MFAVCMFCSWARLLSEDELAASAEEERHGQSTKGVVKRKKNKKPATSVSVRCATGATSHAFLTLNGSG